MAYRGRYTPQNPQKYTGDPSNVIYRSLWERKFMMYCDQSSSIIEWGSEEVIIPYISPWDGRVHRYFPDFYIKVKQHDNKVKKYIIEVKPKKQLKPPKEPIRRTKRYLNEVATYVVNQAKFKAASEYCKDRKYGFRILTEDHLVK